MTYTKQQFNKLPMWARTHISGLERFKKAVESKPSKKSRVSQQKGIGGPIIKHPDKDAMRFKLGPWDDDWVSCRAAGPGVTPGTLKVMCGCPCMIIMNSANSFEIRTEAQDR